MKIYQNISQLERSFFFFEFRSKRECIAKWAMQNGKKIGQSFAIKIGNIRIYAYQTRNWIPSESLLLKTISMEGSFKLNYANNVTLISGKMALIISGGKEIKVLRIEEEYRQLPDKTWGCNYCSQFYKSKSAMITHIDTKHLQVYDLRCFFDCPYIATAKSNLKRHCVNKHAINPRHFDQLAKERNL